MKGNNSILIGIVLLLISLLGNTGCEYETYAQGKRLYEAHCANCHMPDGKGLAKLIPPLAQSDFLLANQKDIPCIIRYGQSGSIIVNGVTYDQEMPGEKYTEVQINNIVNYINNAWGNKLPEVTITETLERMAGCSEN